MEIFLSQIFMKGILWGHICLLKNDFIVFYLVGKIQIDFGTIGGNREQENKENEIFSH